MPPARKSSSSPFQLLLPGLFVAFAASRRACLSALLGFLLLAGLGLTSCVGTPCVTTQALAVTWMTSIGPRYERMLAGGELTAEEIAAREDLAREAADFAALLTRAADNCAGAAP